MTKMNDVPVRHASLLCGVLAHRRDDDAVGELQGSNTERREKFCLRHQPPLELQVDKRCVATYQGGNQAGRSVRRECLQRVIAVILQYALCSAVEIVILPAPERPHEGGKAGKTETDRNGNEKQKIHHLPVSPARRLPEVAPTAEAPPRRSGPAPRRRKAFPITISDDSDMAIAAISGVT